MLALDIKDLVKTYSNGTQALKGVNLEIEEGDFFGFLGANGAGKTTTIGVVTGLVNKSSGTVKVFGKSIDDDISAVKNMIGVVPQEFNFDMWSKVLDIVIGQAGYYGIPMSESKPKAIEVLTKLGLGDKLNVPARTLSGGMKRRLMIARALIHKPRLLILDEPTAGVDVELRHGMWEYLSKINKEEGVTILLTTHYLEEVEQLCKNASIIKTGEIVKNDSVKNLLSSLEKERYVIETPDTTNIKLENPKFELSQVDVNTFEAVLTKTQTLNELIPYLSDLKIQVNSIRPKGNRLEELFLSILKG
jgi:ABC-2 type transport system ATP-binding protein